MSAHALPSGGNPTLEAAIARAPDDLDAYAVYADWLSERGDPRGELAALQLAVERGAGTEAAEERIMELMQQHAEEWGAMPVAHFANALYSAMYLGEAMIRTWWRGGFWHRLDFSGYGPDLRWRLGHPSARLLHQLDIDVWYGLDDEHSPVDRRGYYSYDDAIELLSRCRVPETLRAVSVGVYDPAGSHDQGVIFGESSCPALGELARIVPGLRSLTVNIWGPFGFAPFAELERLNLELAGDAESLYDALVEPQPKLRELVLGSWQFLDTRVEPALAEWLAEPPRSPLHRLIIGCMEGVEEEGEEAEALVRASTLGASVEVIERHIAIDEDGFRGEY